MGLRGPPADALLATRAGALGDHGRGGRRQAAAKRRILDGEARTIVSVRRAIWVRADASSG
jgi:hypothetical protein